MASLIVYVAPEHLDDVLGAGTRAIGRRVPVARAKLPPQIERLDELSTLFLITVERGRALVVASLDEPRPGEIVGDATIHDHDITDLIVRLGCPRVWRVRKWAATPRIVPPNDCQLLRYHLGLPIAGDLPYDDEGPTTQMPVSRPSAPNASDPDARLAELEARLQEVEGWLAKYKADKAADEAITIDRGAHKPASAKPPIDDAIATAPTERKPVVEPGPAAPRPRTGTDPNYRLAASPSRGVSPAQRHAGQHTVAHEKILDALQAMVFAKPASDAARREYGELLVEVGDPRGELILIQLDRIERGVPISDRERELVATVGNACAAQLLPYLETFELRRGFVGKAHMKRGFEVSESGRTRPAWSTVEDLATTDAALLTSAPLTSLRVARVDPHTFEKLGRSARPMSIDSLLPYPARNEPTRGLSLDTRGLDVFEGSAFITRSVCVDASRLGGHVPKVLESQLVRRLSHLDAWIDPTTALAWREGFDKIELPLLTLRFAAHSIEPVIAFERRDTTHRMVVELRATVSSEIAADLAKLIVSLGTGISELELLDTSLAPFPAQQPELIAALGTSFESIKLRRGDSLALV